jgi:CubicO group peptidase (beta-lactamase class C family)
MNEPGLPRSTPTAQGVDPAGVHAFLDTVEAAPDIELHSLMVLRRGHVVAEGWWAPYGPDLPALLYSLSKSFTATAAGIAVAEGLVDLDATVLSYFPELEADVTDPRSRSMRVRHLASMASGHLVDTIDEAIALDPLDLVRGFLLIPPDREPGTVFAYNQPCTYTLATILQRVTGESLTAYLRPRLLDPLGIGPTGWDQHPPGRDLGFTGLYAPTEAVVRLGLLYLRRGRWGHRRLLPEAWVEEATRVHVATPDGGGPDWQQGYGFQFWASRHGYRGDGAYGQFCLVLPEYDAVVATTAATENMQGILDAVWAHLLPAMGDPSAATAAPAAQPDELVDRLARLALPAFGDAEGRPPALDEAGRGGAVFTPAGGRCDAQHSLAAVELRAEHGGWRLSLHDDGEEIGAAVGEGGWATNLEEPRGGPSVPVAVSGGWSGDGTFCAQVRFLETPHRLDVVCSPASATFEATWQTRPLRAGRLGDLRMPR